MNRIGTTPEFGITTAQTGILISSLDYNPSCEEYVQKDNMGEAVGVALWGQKVEVSLEGEVPQPSSTSTGISLPGMGTSLTLANEIPDSIWLGGSAPTATTCYVKGTDYKRTRDGAATMSVTAAVLPFGSTTSGGGVS